MSLKFTSIFIVGTPQRNRELVELYCFYAN
jgi:hypothetical protein